MLILSCFLALLFGSILGLLSSLFIHISAFCDLSLPPEILVKILNIGILTLLCLGGIISKRIRRGMTKKEFRKSVFNSCPNLLRIIAGVIIVYGIIVSVSFLASSFYHVYTNYEADTKENIEIFNSRFYIGLSALWISIYMFEFTLLYCYRKLWKTQVYDSTAMLKVENTNIEL